MLEVALLLIGVEFFTEEDEPVFTDGAA